MKKLKNPEGWMTKPIERGSYWSYFVGQNIYYNLTAAFITTYLVMQGIALEKAAMVLLIVKVWDAINDPLIGSIIDSDRRKYRRNKFLQYIWFGSIGLLVAGALCFVPWQGAPAMVKNILFHIVQGVEQRLSPN